VVAGQSVEKPRLLQNQSRTKVFNQVFHPTQRSVPLTGASIPGWNWVGMGGDNHFTKLVSLPKQSYSIGLWMRVLHSYHRRNNQIYTENTFPREMEYNSSMLAHDKSREFRTENTGTIDQVASSLSLGGQPELQDLLGDESKPVLRYSAGSTHIQSLIIGRYQTHSRHWQGDIPSHDSVSDLGYFPSIVMASQDNPSHRQHLLQKFRNEYQEFLSCNTPIVDTRLQRHQIEPNKQRYPHTWRTVVKIGELSRQSSIVNDENNDRYKNCLDQGHLVHYKTVNNKSVTSVPYLPRSKSPQDWRFNADRLAVVSALCCAIKDMCRTNNRQEEVKSAQGKTIFHAIEVPDIPLDDWLMRLAWWYDCPKESFVLALEYIHRVTNCKSEVEVNYHTAHQLVLTCIRVATKFFDDVAFNSLLYAKVVGLPTATVSALEVQLLFLLSFDLFVSPKQYQSRYKEMLKSNESK